MNYRIGNLRALVDRLIEQAEKDGNEAEHYLGIELVNLARQEGMIEEEIIDALSTPSGHRERRIMAERSIAFSRGGRGS